MSLSKFNFILITMNTIDNENAHVNLIFHIHVGEWVSEGKEWDSY